MGIRREAVRRATCIGTVNDDNRENVTANKRLKTRVAWFSSSFPCAAALTPISESAHESLPEAPEIRMLSPLSFASSASSVRVAFFACASDATPDCHPVEHVVQSTHVGDFDVALVHRQDAVRVQL
jgi:hypothetical protein